MKVLVAALLLLCACRLQAALVRREVPAEEAAPPAEDDFFTRHFQSFSNFMTKDLAQKLQVEELRSQAEYRGNRGDGQGWGWGVCPSAALSSAASPPGPTWTEPTSS